MIRVEIPWPPRILSPNSRAHWAKINRARQKYKHDCYYIGRSTHHRFESDTVTLTINFHPPDKRRRDHDNLLASLKYGLDGLAKAWEIDDSKFRLVIEVKSVVKHGIVVVHAEGK